MKKTDSGTRRRIRAMLIGAASAVPRPAPPPLLAISTGTKRPLLAANNTTATTPRHTSVRRARPRESPSPANAIAATAASGAYRLVGLVAKARPKRIGATHRRDPSDTQNARPSI